MHDFTLPILNFHLGTCTECRTEHMLRVGMLLIVTIAMVFLNGHGQMREKGTRWSHSREKRGMRESWRARDARPRA